MKKLILLLCSLGLLTVMGCGSDNATPEDFGKNYIKQKFSGIPCNVDDLDITVSNEDESTATLTIEGDIQYKETLVLVKKGGKWMLAKDMAKEAPKPVAHKEPAPKKAKH